LFQQCFPLTEDVELCRLYVSYVRRVNDVITGGEKARGIVIQAFEFAVTKVGLDIKSGELWNDYLVFLKSWTPTASWEQQQKVDIIRKVYKKFLVIPTESIETYWTQYTKWENEVNPATSNKFISEKSAEFMLARSWNTEWHNTVTHNKLTRDILPYSVVGEKSESIKTQLKLWLSWIEYEKKNTLEIKDEALVEKRVAYVHRQSILALPFVPELWFKYCKYLLLQNEEANINKCIDLLADGLQLNPKSLLLTFQLAELYEKDKTFEKAKAVYLDITKALQVDHANVTEKIESIKGRVFSSNSNDNNNNETENSVNNNNMADDDAEMETKQVYQLSKEEYNEIAKLKRVQDSLGKSITLVYTKLMIACKRAEGVKEARIIFKQARKNFPAIGYEFFVENALLEHFSDNQKIALKIFELAFKTVPFSTDGKFLLAYLNYLIMINDVDNIRKLIQASDSNLSKEIAQLTETLELSNLNEEGKKVITKEINKKKSSLKRLLKVYITYASKYLSLDVAHSFCTKYEQLFKTDDPIDLFSDRYRIDGINAIKNYEFGDAELDTDDDDEKDKPQRKKRRRENNDKDQPELSTNNHEQPMTNTTFNQPQQESSFVGPTIVALLNALPNASYFGPAGDGMFNNEKLVELFANLPNVSID